MVTFVFMPKRKTILVAPLHWGLGHATRCIPVINALLDEGFKVIIASDGAALVLLRKEFPQLKSLALPSYDIQYPKNGSWFSLHLLWQLPSIQKAISEEKKIVATWVTQFNIDGIISDNRPGVWYGSIPSVYITHQLQVRSGMTTSLSTRMHQAIIKKFTECWVPDIPSEESFSGTMGHLKQTLFPVKYMGLLSRMKKHEKVATYDILCMLSGPEPQRSLLEEILTEALQHLDKRILLVRGLPSEEKEMYKKGTIEIVSYLGTQELEQAINESELIISRSGYTSIMDLAVLDKKAFFVPTPGQYEQQYLAARLEEKGMAPYCKQQDFVATQLERVKSYQGLSAQDGRPNFKQLFSLFESE